MPVPAGGSDDGLYASESELASYLQKDLDTASATLALTIASADFSAAAHTWFTPTTVTYRTTVAGATEIRLPYTRVTAVSAVRVNGTPITGWTLVGDTLYRAAGFGTAYAWPPSALEADVTHGETTVPDDVKGAVLKMAGRRYEHAGVAVSMEQIDDYVVRYDGKPITVAEDPDAVIARYRPIAVA